MKSPIIAITAGEPAGIGPDICIKIAQQRQIAALVVIADPDMLRERASRLNLPLKLFPFEKDQSASPLAAGELYCQPVMLNTPCTPGSLDSRNATYVLETLRLAAKGCQTKQFDAMVTAPVHKGIINDAGHTFSGHTEFLAELTNTPRVVMMLATEGLRVCLATTHLPLAQVPQAITEVLLNEVISIIQQDLQYKFGLAQPRILVCGLNPHAGEGGHLGREEIDIITPTLNRLRQQGMDLVGPLPADTLFTPKYLEEADAVLAMYHDQGLPVLKYRGFGNAVNITLGLPIIRTSVDHGTALDLAGVGSANESSLKVAIEYAVQMVTAQQHTQL